MTFLHRSLFSLVLVVSCLLGMVLSSPASAGPCEIDLQHRSGVTINIDGAKGSGEWTQAGEVSSNGCLDKVQSISTGSAYPVTVYSTRYTDSGTEYLGFLFEVPDGTTQLQGDPSQSTTEQIYIYFDPDLSGGTDLSAAGNSGTDYRLKLQHQWESQPSGEYVSELEWGTPAEGGTCETRVFETATAGLPSNMQAGVAPRNTGSGYIAEIRIPVSALGAPSSDIGIAFAVVDDQGTNSNSSVVTDKYAASFPSALPSGNDGKNPADPCPPEYHKPDNYGIGLWTSTPGDVTISRQPVFWNSKDIKALQCGEMTTYQYYRDIPCELTLEARIHNSRAVDLDRHVLYVWADHGASPSNWRFIDLQEATVPGSGNLTVTSDLWSEVPSELAHHPCVRAYILPGNLTQGGWNEAMVRNVSSNADLSDMMTAYNLSDANWAQKNISANTSVTECPDEGCRVEGNSTPIGVWPQGGNGGSGLILWGTLLVLLLGFTWMTLRLLPRRRARLALGLVVLLGVAAACQELEEALDDRTDEEQEIPVLMSPSEFERFHPGNAIVQMQVYGIIPVENPDQRTANFYDLMGGVIRLLPTEQVVEQRENGIPIEVQVSNTEEEPRRLVLKVNSVLPPELQDENFQLTFEQESDEVVLEPEEVRTLRGRLLLQSLNERR